MMARRRWPSSTRHPCGPANSRAPCPSGPRCSIAWSMRSSVAPVMRLFALTTPPAIPHMALFLSARKPGGLRGTRHAHRAVRRDGCRARPRRREAVDERRVVHGKLGREALDRVRGLDAAAASPAHPRELLAVAVE